MPTMAAITSSAMAVALLLATATVGPEPAWAADAQVAQAGSRNQGAYVGVSVEGAGVFPQPLLDQAYYGRPVSPTQTLIQREVSNPHAGGLIAAVSL